MITINIARGNVGPSQSEDLEGLHLFDVNIIRDDGTSQTGSNTSITIRHLLLLETGAPGHIKPPWGEDWASKYVQDMMSELEAQMNSSLDFHGQKVVIRIAEQPWFKDNNSEDHNTEDHMPMQRVLWEFLERLEVWEPTMRPMEVSVVQTLATGTPKLLDQDEKENGAAGPRTKGKGGFLCCHAVLLVVPPMPASSPTQSPVPFYRRQEFLQTSSLYDLDPSAP
jgi:hypothetical protein